MSIEFRCPQCSRLLRVDESALGKRAQCPECNCVSQVTAAPQTPPPVQPATSPYQSPVDSRSRPGAGSGGPAANAIEIEPIMTSTWEIFKVHFGMGILALLVQMVIFIPVILIGGGVLIGAIAVLDETDAPDEAIVAVFFPTIAFITLLMVLIGSWMQAGYTKMMLRICRDGEARLGDMFSGGSDMLRFTGCNLLIMLSVMLGFLACIIPGVFLMILFSQAGYLVVDRKLGPIAALQESARITNGSRLMIFVMTIIASAISSVAGFIPFGSFVAAPFISMMSAVIYLKLTGQQTSDSMYRRQQAFVITPETPGVPPQVVHR